MDRKTYKTSETVDFIVVGSGASGGIMARELARAGNSVVVMEQGPRLEAYEFEHDELKYRHLSGITNSPTANPQTFRSDPSKAAQRMERNALTYARVVGGSSAHFNANFWRLHEIDFIEGSRWGSIPGADLVDWPITYAELEPYYTMVEWEVGVSGLAGASPFDPPRSKPYPMPPLPVKSSGVLFERGARKLGLHPFPAPLAINSVIYKDRPPCAQCGLCGGFGCEVMAKSSSVWTVIPEAEATGNCEIRSESYVFRIGMNDAGRATGVHYFDKDRKEQFQNARAVVVCANGAETPRLLLNSATNAFPDGLANSSGKVGRYLMCNKGGGAMARFEQPLNEYKGANVTRILHDFYDADEKRGFYGGGGFDARSGGPLTWGQSVPKGTPTWGPGFKEYLESYTYWMNCSGHGTSLAQETNRVDIDPELKDEWGIPAIRVTYRDHPDDTKHANWQADRAVEIMDAAGATQVVRSEVGEGRGGVHLLGTCRMGNNPETSVIDKYHRTHDVRNLFLCDGSSMVTSGRGQPTQTIEALAFRAAEHIARFARTNQI
ncbi:MULTISPECIES: GMC family oxidoreductase [unclassified Sphingobium]|uniref:GMC family oxidoreductase n=1 Tax=unclassified Sphingobium TaxID=2611147 RepID=UPI002225225D|nr:MULTISPECIES: GMC family oxidoreductase [unclassified Sphingobium]MCW2350380.1 choline dehydrogenase-like flavoprotein [Sphingobium sp. B12D2B]MCW2394525.1 choline dehydrogenase-like flavoprotein [Sphingobium sp. B8D3B]MCW2418039.1 choline dehydrogenase-like flavoprotein [Sphingobium sp. B8D3C]